MEISDVKKYKIKMYFIQLSFYFLSQNMTFLSIRLDNIDSDIDILQIEISYALFKILTIKKTHFLRSCS